MAVIKANTNDKQILARLLRAEAEGEGEIGMLWCRKRRRQSN
ncbi:N-acetylmuramoyl-L-alanine amidase [Paenibacillus sp. yr247]|nr:N-acetylmuramoyl-L-alanine amidase [Paenibacillus sp. yr247]